MSGSERLALICAIVLSSSVAHATPSFPQALAGHLATREPDCSLCHVGPQQRGTVNTPFGKSMRSRALVAYDEASLLRALDALDAEKTDSDGDGVPDIAELRAGTDPNAGAGGGASGDDEVPVPEYGCSVRATGAADWPWAAVVACILVALRRRRFALGSAPPWTRRRSPTASTRGATPRSWR